MRIILDIILFFAVLFAPLPVVCALSLLGLFLFVEYVEVVAAFLLYDLLYFGGNFFVDVPHLTIIPLTAYAFLAFVLNGVLRKRIRERLV